MNFMQALRTRWNDADSLVCVGLDPEPAKFPAQFADDPDAVFDFCRAIVDATARLRLRASSRRSRTSPRSAPRTRCSG